jgi:2-polyprenyl-6-methoxyphenol hydroxylase-like FAD-dependent oxidoreductase
MKNERILILGGGYAGVMAAARIARRGTPVTLVDARHGMAGCTRLPRETTSRPFRTSSFSATSP